MSGASQFMRLLSKFQCFLRGQAGQAAVEYSLLIWFFVFVGTITLFTFFFGFEEAIIGYYEDIVNIVSLPVP